MAPSRRWSAVAAGVLLAGGAAASPAPRIQSLLGDARAWKTGDVIAVGHPRPGATPVENAGTILALYLDAGDPIAVRVSLVAPVGIRDRSPGRRSAWIRGARRRGSRSRHRVRTRPGP